MVGSWTGEAIYGLWPFKPLVFRSTSLMPEQLPVETPRTGKAHNA